MYFLFHEILFFPSLSKVNIYNALTVDIFTSNFKTIIQIIARRCAY